MEMFSHLYKGKNVLVTGHTGFKGSWLAIWLEHMGANVIGYSLDPKTEKDNFVMSNINERVIDIRGDIRDTDKINDVFKKYKPEIVFHLAAQPIVRYSYEIPKDTFDINVTGTVNVLEAIRCSEDTKVGVIITSDKCYKNNEWIWGYRENDALGGIDPYSCSKACVELVVESYIKSFFNPEKWSEHGKILASVRAGNVIGGGDWSKDRIIPDSIRALEEGKEIVVRNPNAVRPWQHVLEPLSGYLFIGAKLLEGNKEISGAWNFGPKPESVVTVREIIERVLRYWGDGKWIEPDNKSDLHEAGLLNLDISKAKQKLGWEPRWNIDQATLKTVEWYKNYKNSDAYDICLEQINEYTRSIQNV